MLWDGKYVVLDLPVVKAPILDLKLEVWNRLKIVFVVHLKVTL